VRGALRRLGSLGPALIGTLLVLAVVAVNGRPAVFTDSDNYYKAGKKLVQGAIALVAPAAAQAPPAPLSPRAAAIEKRKQAYAMTSMAARSPYYGALLYSLRQIGTLWLLAAAQAFAAAWLLFLLWRAMAPGSPAWTYYALMAALAALTPLPFVAGFATPDIFAAVAAMGAALLLLWRDRLLRWEQVGVWALLAYSLTVHTSHLLLGMALLVLGVAAGWALKAPRKVLMRGALAVAAALLAAQGLNFAHAATMRAQTGKELRYPPFLTARVLADGPGRHYLRRACAQGEHWTLCRFAAKPLDDSDQILWSNRRSLGVFNLASPAERLAIEKEEPAFVLAVAAHDPAGQFAASMRNWGRQLSAVHVDEALKDPSIYLRSRYWRTTNLAPMIRDVGPCTAAGGCEPRLDMGVMKALHRGVLLLALAYLVLLLTRDEAWAALKRRDWNDGQSRALAVFGLLIAAAVVNAAVCGILSGPFARYQTRVAWLIVAGAGFLGLAFAPAQILAGARLDRLRTRLFEETRLGFDPAFLRFGLVGAIGFLTDAAILHVMVHGLRLDPFAGRLISFSLAVLVTWQLNRSFTFAVGGRASAREALLYFGVQGAGGLANLAVYSAALLVAPRLREVLLVPLAFGSAAGLCLTYLGSKHFAFRKAPADHTPASGVLPRSP
jgi:putative flippase GtrA